MKLSDWLRETGVPRIEFARRIGVTPGAITQICREDGPWISRETAERIVAETGGAVTPNDFLDDLALSRKGTGMADSVSKAIDAFARGEIVIVTDDDDRENEGDLIVAAQHCTTEKMAFIIRNGCGIVCAPRDGGGSAAAEPAADGGAQRRAARHRLHGFGRRAPWPDDGHFGGAAGQYGARAFERQCRRVAISSAPATCFRWSPARAGC